MWSTQLHEISRDQRRAQARFTLAPDQTAWFALTEQPLTLEPDVLTEFLNDTHRTWTSWLAAGQARRTLGDHPYREVEQRSALILKLLSAPDGAIAAAPTSSLPEVLGGERNWDYRYCWLRDSTFTAQALHDLGHRRKPPICWGGSGKPASAANPATSRSPTPSPGRRSRRAKPQALRLKASRPVHVRNGARNQKQLDVYGEVMAA